MTALARTRLQLSVDDFRSYQEQGYLVVRDVVSSHEVQELLGHIEDLAAGRVAIPDAAMYGDDSVTPEHRLDRLLRVHMLHRELEIHERFLLHPRVLDVVQALAGPDVLALQSMLFLKRPGSPGQGFHQDSFHIQTVPDTLVGAWVALDPAGEENGCLWITAGSNHEPVYPDGSERARPGGHRHLAGIPWITGADDPDTDRNELARVAARYAGRETPVVLQPGDVAFFSGRTLHRSHTNRSRTRLRRSFVAHYCNARSFVPWDHEDVPTGEGANDRHILARGATHLPFAPPRFGTPVELD